MGSGSKGMRIFSRWQQRFKKGSKGVGKSGRTSNKKRSNARRGQEILRKGWKTGKTVYKVVGIISLLLSLTAMVECYEELYNILSDLGIDINLDPLEDEFGEIDTSGFDISEINIIDIFTQLYERCDEFKTLVLGILIFIATMITIYVLFLRTNPIFYLGSIFIVSVIIPLITSYMVYDYLQNEILSNDPEDYLSSEMTELLDNHADSIVTQITLAVTPTDDDAMDATLLNCEEEEEDDGVTDGMIKELAEVLGPVVVL